MRTTERFGTIRLMILSFLALAMGACGKESVLASQDKGVTVGFIAEGRPDTKTVLNAETGSFSWKEADRIALWAKDRDGNSVLRNHVFSVSAKQFNDGALFAAVIPSPMEEGEYDYFLTYPLPESVSGRVAEFSLPYIQDGKAGGGTTLCISGWTKGKNLTEVNPEYPVETGLRARLHHLLHYLRFRCPEGGNPPGEKVCRIIFDMPQDVAGTVAVDLTDGSATLRNGVNTMIITPVSPAEEGDYLCAGIFPPLQTYGEDDAMRVTVCYESKYAEIPPISLRGRSFEAGHITSVPLRHAGLKDYMFLRFTLRDNHLGEDVQRITLTLPEGSFWPELGSRFLVYSKEDGSEILAGDSFSFRTALAKQFRALSGKEISVEYESENAIVYGTVTIPDLNAVTSADLDLVCPYLLFEDFSGIQDFSSDDQHATSDPGSKDPHSFGFGDSWSIARGGGKAGAAVRMAARRELFVSYDSRCDSAPLSGIKAGKRPAVRLTFDYSMGRQEGSYVFSAPKRGVTVHVGWCDNLNGMKSGDTDGTFPGEFYINEESGSYDNIDHEYTLEIPDMANDRRISWREVAEFGPIGNGTYWVYLDNIRVSIVKQGQNKQ